MAVVALLTVHPLFLAVFTSASWLPGLLLMSATFIHPVCSSGTFLEDTFGSLFSSCVRSAADRLFSDTLSEMSFSRLSVRISLSWFFDALISLSLVLAHRSSCFSWFPAQRSSSRDLHAESLSSVSLLLPQASPESIVCLERSSAWSALPSTSRCRMYWGADRSIEVSLFPAQCSSPRRLLCARSSLAMLLLLQFSVISLSFAERSIASSLLSLQ